MVYILIHLTCYNKMLQIVWLINYRSYLSLFWVMTLFEIRVLPASLSSYGALYWGVDSHLPSESSHGGKDEGALWDLFYQGSNPSKCFPSGSEGKASACNVGDLGSIPGLGRSSGEGNGNTPVPLPGKSHGPGSPVGYSLWGHKESDTTERLHFQSQ